MTDLVSLGFADELNDFAVKLAVLSGLNMPGQSIFKSIKTAIPGIIYKIDSKLNLTTFYKIENDFEVSSDELSAKINHVLMRYLDADVEVGCFLSSGIDSSTIAAYASKQCQKLKTFTIGFEDGLSEHKDARMFSKKINSEHYEHIVTKKEIAEVTPSLIQSMGAPCLDISYIPTYFASRLAKSNVKAVLSGDGADELFWGYRRHGVGLNIWQIFRYLGVIYPKLFTKSPKSMLSLLQHYMNIIS